MKLNEFKTQFDKLFRTYLHQEIHKAKQIVNHQNIDKYLDHTADYNLSGGKRIRPYIFFITYQWFSDKQTNKIMDFSIIFELLHNMLLIHDDIIDQSDKRHNVDTIHTYINKQIQNTHIAESQAIIIGDLLLSRVYKLLLQPRPFFNPDLLQQAQQNICQLVEEVALWQMIDVDTMLWTPITDQLLQKKNLYKTAKYSFSRPMTTWAILANTDQNTITKLNQLWIQMWLAYQVRDDLMDLVQPDTSKKIFSDIQEWQQTYFTQYIFQQKNQQNINLLQSCLNKQLSSIQIQNLQTMFQDSGAIDFGKKLISQHSQQAQELLQTIPFTNPQTTHIFSALIQKIANISI